MSFGLFGPFGLPCGGPAWQVAKNAAGLAAGGIGVGLRYSPFGPFGPFGRHPSSPKVAAARGFLDSLLGGKPPGPPADTV